MLKKFFISLLFLMIFSKISFSQNDTVKFYYDYFKILNDTTLITPYSENISDKDKVIGLSMLWNEAKHNFANFDLVPNLNWDSLYSAFLDEALKTKSSYEFYNLMRKFYAKLNDGHTRFIGPRELFDKFYGDIFLRAKLIEGKPIIVKVTDEEYKKDVKVGDEIISIDGIPVKQYAEEKIKPYASASTPQDMDVRMYTYGLFSGEAGKSFEVTFKNAKGKAYSKTFLRKFDNWKEAPDYFEFKKLKNNLAYVRIGTFNLSDVVNKFDSVFSEIQKCNALIIDVRENGGGNGNNGFEILGYLTNKPFYQAMSVMRDYNPSERAWNNKAEWEYVLYDWKPYKGYSFDKPIVVLISGMTYSAAEDFTMAFDAADLGTIIGEPTGGSTGQPLWFRIPGGAFAAVCTKRDTYPDGKEFVGVGIQPDILVRPKIEDIRKNKDTVLEAAINYLTGKN